MMSLSEPVQRLAEFGVSREVFLGIAKFCREPMNESIDVMLKAQPRYGSRRLARKDRDLALVINASWPDV